MDNDFTAQLETEYKLPQAKGLRQLRTTAN